jgi:8-oxo-dGTP diphosphatase
MFAIGAFAILFDDQGRVLLCHRRDMDVWNLPGGRVEQGESPWDGVLREVEEEVGLVVEIKRLAGVYHKPNQSEIVFSFICHAVGGQIGTSSEVDRVEFFPLREMPLNTSPRQVERIHDAVDEPSELVLREQTGPGTRELFG